MEQYTNRKFIIGAIILLVGFVFTIQLFRLQVISSTYKLSAESNTRRMEIVYPARGLLYDRNGVLIADNLPSYDLKIAPYELEAFDSLQLCKILGIDMETLRNGIRRVKRSAAERFNPFIKQLSPEVYGTLKEKQWMFPGFYFSTRTLREYRRDFAAHLLGYVGEVDSTVIKADGYYELGDYYGVSGVESTYEQYLRGVKGRKYKLIDVHGREQGSYNEGRYDTDAEVGHDLTLTIDAELQAYGELLMDGYKGSIVAIQPKTGEILTFVSAPGYKPSLLVGRDREANYRMLRNDTVNPLFNYAIQAQYPPGSTFKPVTGMIALQEGVATERTIYYCNLGYHARGVYQRCHSHPSPLDFIHSLETSCNAYFSNLFRLTIENRRYPDVATAYSHWRQYILNLGFADPLGVDLPYEKGGFIPKPDYFDRYFGAGRWYGLTILSMAIGQGEVLTTPIQNANMAAVIANRGYFYVPHIVKKIAGVDTIDSKYTTPMLSNIDTIYFAPVIEGMRLAVNSPSGTAYWVRHPEVVICGKTGTAENPHGPAHSVFIAFAPKDDPQIAISVYVEHGVWGARYAAPIASLMIEKYLTGTIAPERKGIEQRMLDGNLLYKEHETTN